MRNEARKRAAGFSLVEVLVSMGLLSGILAAIAAMFVLAGACIRSGRHLTVATTLAQNVMDDLGPRPGEFGNPDPDAVFASSDTRSAGSAADLLWGLDVRSGLHEGFAVVSTTPLGGPLAPATFASAEGLRVRVTVGWAEMRRARSVTFEEVRF
ncbi:MAG: type IV pilus modification PilV family protein [Candidatus Polarisedimenticolia bacterium]